jgi:pyridoxal phosphate enzyme (YggS family)
MGSIAENLKWVRERIAVSAARAGRDPAEIRLVAVSKTKPASMIREAYEAGQRAFGENYAQELRDKAKDLSDLAIEWHFIGSLQRNKAKYVAPVAAMMESVDSIELAEALNSRAVRPLPCLIEVNVGGEESKTGVAPEAALELARRIIELPNLDLRGVMAIPPLLDDPEASRPYFRKLREVLDQLNRSLSLPSPLVELSMGMSLDFEVAIEEGATIVRVGTAVFGGR